MYLSNTTAQQRNDPSSSSATLLTLAETDLGRLYASMAPNPALQLALLRCEHDLPEPRMDLAGLLDLIEILRGKRYTARAVQKWIKKKGFPCETSKLNGRREYRLSAVIDWLQNEGIDEPPQDRMTDIQRAALEKIRTSQLAAMRPFGRNRPAGRPRQVAV